MSSAMNPPAPSGGGRRTVCTGSARTSWMQLPGGDNLWSSRNVAATRPFLVSSRPDGSRTFLRELIRNQGIDTAYLNAVDELLQELTHGFFSNRRCRGTYLVPLHRDAY